MQDLLWENRPPKGRRQVFDIGEAKIVKIRYFERERGVLVNKRFWIEIKIIYGFLKYVLSQHLTHKKPQT